MGLLREEKKKAKAAAAVDDDTDVGERGKEAPPPAASKAGADKSLHTKYRPTTFKEVIGQDAVVSSLSKLLKKGGTRAFLFTGGSGVGKTTLGRIIASKVGCSRQNLVEVDAATNSGIDAMRAITESMQFSALGGSPTKVYILDECFASGTLIEGATGPVSIESVCVGDRVWSHKGLRIVTQHFINRVALDRVLRVWLTNGCSLFCSEDHLFFTLNRGWIPAKDLHSADSLSKFVLDTDSLKENANANLRQEDEALSSLPGMQGRVSVKDGFKAPSLLLQEMLGQKKCGAQHGEKALASNEAEDEGSPSLIQKKESGVVGESSAATLSKDEEGKSFQTTRDCGEDESYEEGKWDAQRVLRRTGRERTAHRTPNSCSDGFGLEDRGGNPNRISLSGFELRIGVPPVLQSRCGQRTSSISDRGGWEGTLTSQEKGSGREEGSSSCVVRVAGAAHYERGCNDELFKDVVTDKEVHQGFVLFHDLEVEGAHSYYVDGVLVHNCHALGKAAWQSLLKSIEEPPPHVYWILCTTEDTKVPATIRTRCTHYSLKPVSRNNLMDLLEKVREAEGYETGDDVLQLIASKANGSPRFALTALAKCARVEDRAEAAELMDVIGDEDEGEVGELCRALIRGCDWEVAVEIVNKLKDQNPESIRCVVANWFEKALLGTKDEKRAGKMLDILAAFEKPYATTQGIYPVLLSVGDVVLG